MAEGNFFLVRFKAPHTRKHGTGTGNLAKNTWLGPHSTRVKPATIVCLFCKMNIVSSCPLNLYLPTYRSVQLSVLIREVSLCSRWLLMWKLITDKCVLNKWLRNAGSPMGHLYYTSVFRNHDGREVVERAWKDLKNWWQRRARVGECLLDMTALATHEHRAAVTAFVDQVSIQYSGWNGNEYTSFYPYPKNY